MYESLKIIHMSTAAVSISGFLLRAYWMMTSSARLRQRWVRILPHVVDTVFLVSGVSLYFVMNLSLTHSVWLQIKLVALVFYVVLGSIALKRGKTKRSRLTAFVLALVTFAYITGVALSKSAGSWLILVTR